MKLPLVFLLLFLLPPQMSCLNTLCMNVGTVLFTESDLVKRCWSPDQLALLMSRMILEDVLPQPRQLQVDNESFVNDIVEYFRIILEVVRKMTTGKIRHIMLLAITDLLGGYLNHIVLPMAKYAFYAGKINFDSMQKLFQLFDEIKCFLRTSGNGWAHPVQPNLKNMRIEPIVIDESKTPDKGHPCEGLIYTEKEHVEPHKAMGSKCMTNNGGLDIEFPMPFFDSRTKPAAIAVPFKAYTMRNIESKAAASIIVKFYIVVHKCLKSKHAHPNSAAKFDNALFAWLRRFALPHLKEDKFYSAFGGVLRIYETLVQNGVGKFGSKTIGNYNIMPEVEDKLSAKEKDLETGELIQSGKGGGGKSEKEKKSSLVIYALLVVIFVWFLLGSLFICYRMRASRMRKAAECPGVCPSKSTSKSTSGPASKCSSGKNIITRTKSATTDKSETSTGPKSVDSTRSVGRKRTCSPCAPTTKSTGTSASHSESSWRQRAVKAVKAVPCPLMKLKSGTKECKCDNTKTSSKATASRRQSTASKASNTTQRSGPTSKSTTSSVYHVVAVERSGSSQTTTPTESKNTMTASSSKTAKSSCTMMSRSFSLRRSCSSKKSRMSSTTDPTTDKTTTTTTTTSTTKGTPCSARKSPRSSSRSRCSSSARQSPRSRDESSTQRSTSSAQGSEYDPNCEAKCGTKGRKNKKGSKSGSDGEYTSAMYACHTSMTGKYKGSTTTDATSSSTGKKPFVFGYDFQTSSSETTPRGTTDGESEFVGNMSK